MKIKGINACEATAIVTEHTVILLEAWGVGGVGRGEAARSACVWNGGRLEAKVTRPKQCHLPSDIATITL